MGWLWLRLLSALGTLFSRKEPKPDPRKGELSFNRDHKFKEDLPKIDPIILEQFLKDLEHWRASASK